MMHCLFKAKPQAMIRTLQLTCMIHFGDVGTGQPFRYYIVRHGTRLMKSSKTLTNNLLYSHETCENLVA